MKEELKQFGINIEDIKESNELLDNISEAIHQMSLATMKDRFEVILNNNLVDVKEKATNYRTIFGCRISYDNLPKDVSFIVREDTKPTYEELEQQLQQKENIIKEVREYIENKEIDTLHFNSKDFLDTSIAGELLEILDKALGEKNE